MIAPLIAKLTLRERVLGLLFLFVALLIWGSLLLEKRDVVTKQLQQTRQELSVQQTWLQNAFGLEQRLNAALAEIDQTRTLTAAELVGLIDGYARSAGLRHDLTSPITEHGNIFSQHSVRANLRNLTMAQLIRLEETVFSHYPYLSLDQLSITANRADPTLLNVTMTLSAFELRYNRTGTTSTTR